MWGGRGRGVGTKEDDSKREKNSIILYILFTGLDVLKNIYRMDFSVKYGVRSLKFI
jgi:hypothetical protein